MVFLSAGLVSLMVRRTPYGRRCWRSGRAAARRFLAGIAVDRTILFAYVLSGVLAGLTGALLAASVGSADLELGNPFLLTSVGAVVLGGNRIAGGTASVVGTVLGAFLLTLLVVAVTVAGLPIEAKHIASGLVITVVLVAAAAPDIRRRSQHSIPPRRPRDAERRTAFVTESRSSPAPPAGSEERRWSCLLELGASVVAEDIDPASSAWRPRRPRGHRPRRRARARDRRRRGGAVRSSLRSASTSWSTMPRSSYPRTSSETTEAEWDEVMAVNVKGAFHHVRAALPDMLERGRGAIVNVTSISGVVGLPKQAAYCASKGALVQMTRQLAIEYADRGIRVNSVAPGAIDTPFLARHLDAQPDRAAAEADVRAAHPLGRYASPAEIAEAIAYLASDASSFLTGAILMADGGYTAR